MYHYYPLAPEYCLVIIAVCILTLLICHFRYKLTANGKRTVGRYWIVVTGIVFCLVKHFLEHG